MRTEMRREHLHYRAPARRQLDWSLNCENLGEVALNLLYFWNIHNIILNVVSLSDDCVCACWCLFCGWCVSGWLVWCRLQRALPGLVLFCLKRFLISVWQFEVIPGPGCWPGSCERVLYILFWSRSELSAQGVRNNIPGIAETHSKCHNIRNCGGGLSPGFLCGYLHQCLALISSPGWWLD